MALHLGSIKLMAVCAIDLGMLSLRRLMNLLVLVIFIFLWSLQKDFILILPLLILLLNFFVVAFVLLNFFVVAFILLAPILPAFFVLSFVFLSLFFFHSSLWALITGSIA